MGVEAEHPDYLAHVDEWQTCRDAIAGEAAVKAAGVRYLPRLSGQRINPRTMSDDYVAYRDRACYFAAPGRTATGLGGAITKTPIKVDLPPDLDDKLRPLLRNFTKDGQSFTAFADQLIDEVLQVGRAAVLVDSADGVPNARPYATIYTAENLKNWRSRFTNDREEITLAVLAESIDQPTDDEFTVKQLEARRVLRLSTTLGPGGAIDEQYSQQVYVKIKDAVRNEDKWVAQDPIVPRVFGGSTMRRIPLVVLNEWGVGTEVGGPPLKDMCYVALSYYRNSADLEHGRHWCALPTAVGSGFQTTDKDGNPIEFFVGGETAWITETLGATAWYLEFRGTGLGHIADGMKEKKLEMAVLGARLLEEQKAGVEAAEAIRMRLHGERSALARIAASIEEALNHVVRWWVMWQVPSADPDQIRVTVNDDFVDAVLSAQDIVAMMKLAQAGMMSWPTLFWNLKRAYLVPDDRTEQDEQKLIVETLRALSAQQAALPSAGSPGPGVPAPAGADAGDGNVDKTGEVNVGAGTAPGSDHVSGNEPRVETY